MEGAHIAMSCAAYELTRLQAGEEVRIIYILLLRAYRTAPVVSPSTSTCRESRAIEFVYLERMEGAEYLGIDRER